MSKDDLISRIRKEYETAYKEIESGQLKSIPVGKGLMKNTFCVSETHNWGLTTGKKRRNGNKGDITTFLRLEKLASYELFTEQNFQNFKGNDSLHKLIGGNDTDAKYIMQYLYNRVKKDIVDKATEDEHDFGYEGRVLDKEGNKIIVEVNRYERSRKLRKECIREHGNKYECLICGFNFEKMYGDRGKEFIHIHHKVPLKEMGKEQIVSTQKLIPVCPNCHAMLHRGKELLDPEELRKIIEENRKNN